MESDPGNVKITTPEDVRSAEMMTANESDLKIKFSERNAPESERNAGAGDKGTDRKQSGAVSESSYEGLKSMFPRIGLGCDVHALVEGKKLVLGGVQIPYGKGLEGHSDADVLIHAVIDALLGAAGLGDIGKHFPDTDENYRGISSLVLLERTAELLIPR